MSSSEALASISASTTSVSASTVASTSDAESSAVAESSWPAYSKACRAAAVAASLAPERGGNCPPTRRNSCAVWPAITPGDRSPGFRHISESSPFRECSTLSASNSENSSLCRRCRTSVKKGSRSLPSAARSSRSSRSTRIGRNSATEGRASRSKFWPGGGRGGRCCWWPKSQGPFCRRVPGDTS